MSSPTHNPPSPRSPSPSASTSPHRPPPNTMLFRDFFLSIIPPSLRVLNTTSGQKRVAPKDPPTPSSDAATSALLIDDWKQAFEREKKASALHAAALHKTKAELQRAQGAVGACKREMARMEAEMEGLRREVDRWKRETNELRAFFPGGAGDVGVTLDLKGVERTEARAVELTKGINEEISQLARALSEANAHSNADLTGERTPMADRACETIAAWVGPGVVQLLRTDFDSSSALETALQACMANWARRVAVDWLFGSLPVVDALRELDARLGKAETEPVARRWRALTRKHVREAFTPPAGTAPLETQLSVHGAEFLALVLLAAGSAPTLASARSNVDSYARDRIKNAMRLAMEANVLLGEQTGMGVGTMEPYVVAVGSIYDPATMESGVRVETEGGGKWGVLCTTQLGLRARGGLGEESAVLVKPKVVLCRLQK